MTSAEKNEQPEGISRRALIGGAAVGGFALAATMLGPSSDGAAAAPRDKEELAGFMLEGLGLQETFGELLSLVQEVKLIEYQEGTSSGPIFGRLGDGVPPVAVLRRAFTGSTVLQNWHQQARMGSQDAYRDVSLVLLSSRGEPTFKYFFENAIPIKLEIAPVPSSPATALFETLTLSCDEVIAQAS